MPDHEPMFPHSTRELAEHRTRLAPAQADAFRAFSKSVFAEGTLSAKTKQLIAVAVAHVTQCPYCIRGHTGAALHKGATAEEIMEAIWVAAELRGRRVRAFGRSAGYDRAQTGGEGRRQVGMRNAASPAAFTEGLFRDWAPRDIERAVMMDHLLNPQAPMASFGEIPFDGLARPQTY